MPEPVIYFIPNTFTPNGDELNNVFQPIFTFGYDPENYSFYIYDRWDELIFESHDSKIGWDGTYGSNLVQNDTYIWKLEFKEKLKETKHFKTGHVNVFR
jgi:gliding motility-associated-like protein